MLYVFDCYICREGIRSFCVVNWDGGQLAAWVDVADACAFVFVLGDDDGENEGGACGSGLGGVFGYSVVVFDYGLDVVEWVERVEVERKGEKYVWNSEL